RARSVSGPGMGVPAARRHRGDRVAGVYRGFRGAGPDCRRRPLGSGAVLPLLPGGLPLLALDPPRLLRHRHAAPPVTRRLGPDDPPRARGGVADTAADGALLRAASVRPPHPLRLGPAGRRPGGSDARPSGALPQRSVLHRAGGALLRTVVRLCLASRSDVAPPG